MPVARVSAGRPRGGEGAARGPSGGDRDGRSGGARQAGGVGEWVVRLADPPEHDLAGVTDHLADTVEAHEAQPLVATSSLGT